MMMSDDDFFLKPLKHLSLSSLACLEQIAFLFLALCHVS